MASNLGRTEQILNPMGDAPQANGGIERFVQSVNAPSGRKDLQAGLQGDGRPQLVQDKLAQPNLPGASAATSSDSGSGEWTVGYVAKTALEFGAGMLLGRQKVSLGVLALETLGVATTGAVVSDLTGPNHLGQAKNTLSGVINGTTDWRTGASKLAHELIPFAAETGTYWASTLAGATASRALSREIMSARTLPNLSGVDTLTSIAGHNPEVYRNAGLYDVAFSYRNISAETDALTGMYARATGKANIDSVIELAAGPGQHAREFATRGVNASVLDYSEDMVRFAQSEAKKGGTELSAAIRGDMTNFTHNPKSDLAITMLDSTSHLKTEEALAEHFISVGKHVKPGGAYIIEMDNPNAVNTTASAWKMAKDGTEVNIQWGKATDPFDPVTKLRTTSVELHATTPGGPVSIAEKVVQRQWEQAEVERAIAKSGFFDQVERYGDFSTDAAYDPEKSWRLIYVLRRASNIP